MPSKGSCTSAQLDILEEATRVAALVTHESVPDTEIAAFQRYFVTDGRVSGRWINQHRTDYMNLLSKLSMFIYPISTPAANTYRDAIKQVSDFALTGKNFPNGTPKADQRNRITYRCTAETVSINSCRKAGV